MLDAFSLDQLRILVTVADEGSFSAAGRRLKRVQSAISHAMAHLEAQLGVTVWDRQPRIPRLTAEGERVVSAARRVLDDVDALKRVAEGLAGGLEATVSIAVDAFLPLRTLVDLTREFAAEYPGVQLRLHTETLAAVAALVLDGTCQIGVVGPAAETPGLERTHLASVLLVPVVGKRHPLASRRGRLSTAALADHVHIVLSERSAGARTTRDQAVLSPRTWRVADLATKHALLVAGLGWGNMPEHRVREDLAKGRLVRIRPAAWGDDEWLLSLSLVHRADLAKGPATRWLLDRLSSLCARSRRPRDLKARRFGLAGGRADDATLLALAIPGMSRGW